MKKFLLCALLVVLFVCPVLAEAAVTSDDSPPVIIEHPSACWVSENETATFSVTAVGAEPLAYQWQYKKLGDNPWMNISGANSADYSFTAKIDSEMEYRVIVSNMYGSVMSNSAFLSFPPDLGPYVTIITQPVSNTTVTEGNISGSLFVEASVSSENHGLIYQWFSNTDNSNENGTLIQDATSATFTIPPTLQASEKPYYYYCVVSPSLLDYTAAYDPRPDIRAISEVATVTVNHPDSGGGCNSFIGGDGMLIALSTLWAYGMLSGSKKELKKEIK